MWIWIELNPIPKDGSGSNFAYSSKRSIEVKWISVSDDCIIPHCNRSNKLIAVVNVSPTEHKDLSLTDTNRTVRYHLVVIHIKRQTWSSGKSS